MSKDEFVSLRFSWKHLVLALLGVGTITTAGGAGIERLAGRSDHATIEQVDAHCKDVLRVHEEVSNVQHQQVMHAIQGVGDDCEQIQMEQRTIQTSVQDVRERVIRLEATQ